MGRKRKAKNKYLIFRSIGLFWHEEEAFWGRQRNPGGLYGIDAKSRRDDPVDFSEQVGICALYADYNLVYVGQTGKGNDKPLFRLRKHKSDDLAGRWNRFSWFGFREVLQSGRLSKVNQAARPSLEKVLNHVEAIVIHAAEPQLNSQDGRFGNKVRRYLQYRDDRLGQGVEEMIHDLWERQVENNGSDPNDSDY